VKLKLLIMKMLNWN